MTEITIGADPELFLKRGRSFVSVEDANGPIIPGTKSEPFPVKGGAIQVDGVAAEFNINPAKNFTEFAENITSVVGELKTRIQEYDPKIKLVPKPTAVFKDDYFFKLPKHTLELGCEPDFDAYNDGKANPRPETDEPFRTGSGHIHIGWREGGSAKADGHMKDCIMVVQELDRYLFPLSKLWDSDDTRRKLYGAKGSFRPKSFGVEYRPLSNKWLESYDSMKAVYDITYAVVRSLDSGHHQFKDPVKIKKGTPIIEACSLIKRSLSS